MNQETVAPPPPAPYRDHAERTATEPRQPGIHEVILSKIVPVNQTIKLFELSLAPEPKKQFKASFISSAPSTPVLGPSPFIDIYILASTLTHPPFAFLTRKPKDIEFQQSPSFLQYC